MIRKTLRFSGSCIFFLLHLLTAAVLLGLALVTFALWQFSKGPVDLTFAADYIKGAFEVEGQPVTVDFDSVVAAMPNMQGMPDINLKNFRVVEAGEEKLRVSDASLKIALLPLFVGKVAPETIMLNGPEIRLLKETDGNLRFLLSDNDKPQPATDLPTLAEIGDNIFLGGALPNQIMGPFSNLKAINIVNATLVAQDENAQELWTVPSLSFYLARTRNTLDMTATYAVEGREEMSVLNARVARSRVKNTKTYSATLRNVDAAVIGDYFGNIGSLQGQSMVLDGLIEGALNPDWSVQTAQATVSSDSGKLRLSSASDKMFTYEDLMINLAYDQPSGRLELTDTKMKLNDTMVSIVAGTRYEAHGRKIIPLTMKVPELTLAQVNALWPEAYRDSNAAEWITRDLSGATLRNIDVTANIPADDPGSFSGNDIDVSFDFENLKADYRAPLIPATEAKGRGTIRDNVLDIHVDTGKIGDLAVSDARIVITELASDAPGMATIDVALSGPLSTVFEYISLEPISLGDTIGMNPKQVGGTGDYKVNIVFPTAPDIPVDAVKVKVDATLNDTRLPGIVQGMDITGGPLDLEVADGAFTISGKGLLDGSPLDLVYSEYLDPSTAPFASDIKAKVLTTKKMRDTFGINLEQFVSGDLPAEIHYKEPKPGDVTVSVDLDMTPVTAFVEPFNFIKRPGAPGRATCVAVLKDDRIQVIKDLEVVMGKDKASGGVITFGQVGKEWDVKSGSFKTIALGNENNFSLKFTQPAERKMNFVIAGEKMDARAFLSAGAIDIPEPTKPSTSVVTVTAETKTARTGDIVDQVVQSPKVKAEVDPNGDIRLLDITATVGSGPLMVSMKPDEAGQMRLKVRAADAGTTLHAFDLYDSIVGGQLFVDGRQLPGGKINDIKGIATIRDFRAVDAPVLAQLMNSFSFDGMDELVKRKGIAFTRLRANFVWKDSPEGRVIVVNDGRTSGASIGLSFEGTVNQTKGTMDLGGTFVPMSKINKFVSKIPLVGQLLTGGKDGGIIAATYSVKGPSDKPRVTVNPLSVLTPGFLRSILFEGGLDKDDEEHDPRPAPPKVERRQLN